MARGVDGRDIFCDTADRIKFLNVLRRVAADSHAAILAYCLMDNHFHLALKVTEVPLSAIIQRILTSHSLSFNRKHARSGHLFQARYKSVLCTDQAYLITLIRYIHMNPVRAGVTTAPGLWPWSSYGEYRQENRDGLIESELDIPDLDDPIPSGFKPWPTMEIDSAEALLRTPVGDKQSLEELAGACLRGSSVTVNALRSKSRRRDVARYKRELIRRGIKDGHSLTTLSEWLGIGVSSVQHYLKAK
jgi:REP element-mobilizing transposase RayT